MKIVAGKAETWQTWKKERKIGAGEAVLRTKKA
jgi:hypothetical protein